jgi:hypothetical protein
VYGKRENLTNIKEVIDDLSQLHKLVNEKIGYEMKLSRPPHYIDKIHDGHTSYDAYRYMNYNYLAASFDGGGWKPSCGDYRQDVNAMTEPLKMALDSDINSLNGQIIFQKDGYNMSHQTPVVDALPQVLELLTSAGYKVVTASELISMSPFEKIDDTDAMFIQARDLARAGYAIGYQNNTFQPDRTVTRGELAMMTIPPDILLEEYRKVIQNEISGSVAVSPHFKDVNLHNPYLIAIEYAAQKGWFHSERVSTGCFRPNDPITISEFADFLDAASEGINIEWYPDEFSGIGQPLLKPGLLRRRDVIMPLTQLNLKLSN